MPGRFGKFGKFDSSCTCAGGRESPLLPLPRPWVEGIAQPVADEIGGQHRGEEEGASKDRDPPGLLQPGLTGADDTAPCWGLGWHAGAEERERCLGKNRERDDECALHDQW